MTWIHIYYKEIGLDIEGRSETNIIKICDVTRFNVIFCKYFGYKHFT